MIDWALLIVGSCLLIVLVMSPVLIAVILSRTLTRQAYSAERMHERVMGMLAECQDRIMAVDYTQFVAWRSSAEAEAGGFVAPGESGEEDGVETIRSGWGAGSPVRVRLASLVEGDDVPGLYPEPDEEEAGVPSR